MQPTRHAVQQPWELSVHSKQILKIFQYIFFQKVVKKIENIYITFWGEGSNEEWRKCLSLSSSLKRPFLHWFWLQKVFPMLTLWLWHYNPEDVLKQGMSLKSIIWPGWGTVPKPDQGLWLVICSSWLKLKKLINTSCSSPTDTWCWRSISTALKGDSLTSSSLAVLRGN